MTWSHSSKRKHELEKKKTASDLKPVKEQVEDARQAGLAKPIDTSNKGHQLLMKMGFKGKLGPQDASTSTESKFKEPIPIVIKANRLGIGAEEKISNVKKVKLDPETERSFSDHTKNSLALRNVRTDLVKSQHTCYTLDSDNGIEVPFEEYFWPASVIESLKEDNTSDKEESSKAEPPDEPFQELETQLESLTNYLRTTYQYCLWCGITFESEEDMKSNCPGPARLLHDE